MNGSKEEMGADVTEKSEVKQWWTKPAARFIVISLMLSSSGYLLSIATITVISADDPIQTFPDKCPQNSGNCVQIGPTYHRSEGLQILRFEAPLDEIEGAAYRWIEEQPRTEILFDAPDLTHAVFVTSFWRFRDDFVIQTFCDENETVIWIHSASRIGMGDLGVNPSRVKSFHEHMLAQTFTKGNCSA